MDGASLREFALFEGLTDEQLDACASHFNEVEVLTDTHMTEKDDFGYTFFVVLSGVVKVIRDDVEVARLGRGEFFGEHALLSGERRNAAVIAVERTRLAKMMVWDLKDLLDKTPNLARRLQEIVKSRG